MPYPSAQSEGLNGEVVIRQVSSNWEGLIRSVDAALQQQWVPCMTYHLRHNTACSVQIKLNVVAVDI